MIFFFFFLNVAWVALTVRSDGLAKKRQMKKSKHVTARDREHERMTEYVLIVKDQLVLVHVYMTE